MKSASSDTQVTLAQSALKSMPSAASEDASGFVARRVLNGALMGALITAGVAFVVVLLIRPFDARNLLALLFAALLGGLFRRRVGITRSGSPS